MHESSLKRMRWFKERYMDQAGKYKVLDVGSYNVNGCYKEIFEEDNIKYHGLDMEHGPNVDIVPKMAYKWEEIIDDSYECVISGQALEHIEFFWITVAEMIRVTKKNGLICIIAPNGFQEHRYPVDCWRFFTDGMIALARYYQLDVIHAHTNAAPTLEEVGWYSSDCADSMLIARKAYSGKARITDLSVYKCRPADQDKVMGDMIKYEVYEQMIKKTKAEMEEKKIIPEPRIRKKIKNTKRFIKELLSRYKKDD